MSIMHVLKDLTVHDYDCAAYPRHFNIDWV
jgi:hypothetical protein